MHELAVARSLVEAADREAERFGARAVLCVRCRLGVLRQVDSWLLQEAFNVARQGTLCESSRLLIEKTDLSAACGKCDVRFPIQDGRWDCPACGAEGTDVSGGDELELTSIDVESDDEFTQPSKPTAADCETGVSR
ncbi:MAG TPA: hydrogenase maturation nickel metallochaperone HypA [Phycisphaerae bacterium]|nr:hydrogenase maturation nickel metallochaperone HypA [Phycisphaerae bacterium]